MGRIVAALLPAAAVGIFYFGVPALGVLLVTTAGCAVLDALARRLPGGGDVSLGRGAAVTGLLLGMCLPPGIPWWAALSGCAVAVLAPRLLSRVIGFNPLDPVPAALAFLLLAVPGPMTSWLPPTGLFATAPDAVTAATPLAAVRGELQTGGTETTAGALDLVDGLVGRIPGACGETSALALALGGLFLLRRGAIGWQVPLSFLGVAAGLAAASSAIQPGRFPGAGFHLVTGGLVLGAFFLAASGPAARLGPRGRLVYGAGCGLLTWLLRSFGSLPEGVAFAILLMDLVVPAIGLYSRGDAPDRA